MTVQRVDYIVRVSFSTPLVDSTLTLEQQAEEIMAVLINEAAAGADEAEIVHRRVFEDPEASPPAKAPVLYPCARCMRYRASWHGRYCANCWRLTR